MKTAKLFKGQGYVSLRPLHNGITYRYAWEFRLRKTPGLVFQPKFIFSEMEQTFWFRFSRSFENQC